MKMIIISPVLILWVLFFLYVCFIAIHDQFVISEGGSALSGGYVLQFALVALAVIAIDQVIIRFFKPTRDRVWVVETVLVSVV